MVEQTNPISFPDWLQFLQEKKSTDINLIISSAALNILKWAIVPALGLAGSLKNKLFIEGLHCKMKIMQG